MEEQDKVCRENLKKVEVLCGIGRKAISVALGKDVEFGSAVKQEENNIAMFEKGAEERAFQISSKMQKQQEKTLGIEEHQQMIEDEEELDLVL